MSAHVFLISPGMSGAISDQELLATMRSAMAAAKIPIYTKPVADSMNEPNLTPHSLDVWR